MTDILYVCGKGGGDMLRLSLRSLSRFGRNVGRVVVAGYCPAWLSDDVIKVRVDDITVGGYKHINIINCILTAIDRGAVRGNFLYSSVDHFLGSETDFDFGAYPFYVRPGVLLSYEEATRRDRGPSMYNASLAATKILLDAHGLDTRLYCCHANTWMNADDSRMVREIIDSARQYDRENYGFEPTCLFMAVRNEREPVHVKIREDVKIYDVDDGVMSGAFSIGDWDGCSNALQRRIIADYGLPSQWERQSPAARRKRARRPKSAVQRHI